jgi:hypothetical protein
LAISLHRGKIAHLGEVGALPIPYSAFTSVHEAADHGGFAAPKQKGESNVDGYA